MTKLTETPKEAFLLAEVFWKLGKIPQFTETWVTLYAQVEKRDPNGSAQSMDELWMKIDTFFDGEAKSIEIKEEK